MQAFAELPVMEEMQQRQVNNLSSILLYIDRLKNGFCIYFCLTRTFYVLSSCHLYREIEMIDWEIEV